MNEEIEFAILLKHIEELVKESPSRFLPIVNSATLGLNKRADEVQLLTNKCAPLLGFVSKTELERLKKKGISIDFNEKPKEAI